MLDAAQVGDQDRYSEPGRAAHAVAQPQRLAADCDPARSLRRRQRPRDSRPAPGRAAASIQAAPLRGGGDLGVPRDLRDDEAQLLRAEAWIQRTDRCARSLAASADSCGWSSRARARATLRAVARARRRAPSRECAGASSSSAASSSVVAAAFLTAQTCAPDGVSIGCGRRARNYRLQPPAARRPGARPARVEVLSPVGRYGVAKSSSRALRQPRRRRRSRPCARRRTAPVCPPSTYATSVRPAALASARQALTAVPRMGLWAGSGPQQRDREQRRDRGKAPARDPIGDRGRWSLQPSPAGCTTAAAESSHPARTELTTPEKITANPTTAIEAAGQPCVARGERPECDQRRSRRRRASPQPRAGHGSSP